MEGMGRAWEAFPSRQGNLPFAAWQGNPVCAARKGAAGSLRGGVSCRASAGMSPKSVDSCQKVRFSAPSRVRMTGRKDGNRSRSVKKQAGELSVWSISPPWRAFLCGKNGISLLKEIYFLPQRRKFLSAKKFPGVWKEGKNGASDGFFPLIGGCARAKTVCLFASLPPRPAGAGAASVRTAARGGRQSVAKTRLPAFILHFRRSARFAHFRPRPSFRPSARFSQCRF